MTSVTRFPVLRPVEAAACFRGGLDVEVVVLGGREMLGNRLSRSVLEGESSTSAVVAVRAVVVVGEDRRGAVVEDGELAPRALVVVGTGPVLVVVAGATVVEAPLSVVVVMMASVVLERLAVVVVDGMGVPCARAGVVEGTNATNKSMAVTMPTTTTARCRSPTLGMVGGLPQR